jgi:hypothetical protein
LRSQIGWARQKGSAKDYGASNVESDAIYSKALSLSEIKADHLQTAAPLCSGCRPQADESRFTKVSSQTAIAQARQTREPPWR